MLCGFDLQKNAKYKSVVMGIGWSNMETPCRRVCRLKPEHSGTLKLNYNFLLKAGKSSEENVLQYRFAYKKDVKENDTAWSKISSSYYTNDGVGKDNVAEIVMLFNLRDLSAVIRLWVYLAGTKFTISCNDSTELEKDDAELKSVVTGRDGRATTPGIATPTVASNGDEEDLSGSSRPSDDSSTSPLLWYALAGVLVGAAVILIAVLLLLRRRRRLVNCQRMQNIYLEPASQATISKDTKRPASQSYNHAIRAEHASLSEGAEVADYSTIQRDPKQASVDCIESRDTYDHVALQAVEEQEYHDLRRDQHHQLVMDNMYHHIGGQ